MSKRRTRKDKENALHTYHFQPRVNGQLKFTSADQSSKKSVAENAILMAQDKELASTKRNLVRSLLIISFILALELVIYLVWRA